MKSKKFKFETNISFAGNLCFCIMHTMDIRIDEEKKNLRK